MKPEWITVSEYKEEGYKPMIAFGEWRVAVLRYIDELEIEQIQTMQKHSLTDEVFILLEGQCTLFTGGNSKNVQELDSIDLEPLKMYNVKKGTWHTHTLAADTTVLIVENDNTCDDNSPIQKLSTEEKEALKQLFCADGKDLNQYYKR